MKHNVTTYTYKADKYTSRCTGFPIYLYVSERDYRLLCNGNKYPFISVSSGSHILSGFITMSSNPSKSLAFHRRRLSYQSYTEFIRLIVQNMWK